MADRDRDRQHLHPAVQVLLARHENAAARYGLRTRLIETYRDEAQQAADFAKGRDVLGRVVNPAAVVTNAPPGASYHGVVLADGRPASLAYHLAIVTPGEDLVLGTHDDGLAGFGRVTLDDTWRAILLSLGLQGEALGLTWGGRWPSRDYTHFEKRISGLNLAGARQRVLAGGVIA